MWLIVCLPTESSRDHSPQQSKNISVEDMGRLGVENIEISALSSNSLGPGGDNKDDFSSTVATVTRTNGNPKTNGYMLADSGLNKVRESIKRYIIILITPYFLIVLILTEAM